MRTSGPAPCRSVADVALPDLIAAYLERAVPADARDARCVRITQVGEMLKRSGGRPMRFTAVEDFAADRVAFAWEARFAIAPLVTLKVHDGYIAGAGALRVSALGFPVMRQAGATVDVGGAWVLAVIATPAQMEGLSRSSVPGA